MLFRTYVFQTGEIEGVKFEKGVANVEDPKQIEAMKASNIVFAVTSDDIQSVGEVVEPVADKDAIEIPVKEEVASDDKKKK